MHLSRRRLLGSLALAAGSSILAACGQSSAPSPSATSAPAKPGESTLAAGAPGAAAPPASSGGGPVTISVIAWNSGSSAEAFKNAMAQINDKFKQKRPNVTVNFEPL